MSARPSAAARYSGEKPLPSTTAASPPSADTSFSRTASWPFRMASCIAVALSEFLALSMESSSPDTPASDPAAAGARSMR